MGNRLWGQLVVGVEGRKGEFLTPGLALGFLRKVFSTWLLLTVNPSLRGPCLQAGKFDIIPTMTTIGSGIGIFGVVSARVKGSVEETNLSAHPY